VYIELQPFKNALRYSRKPHYRIGGRLLQSYPGIIRGLGTVIPPLRRLNEFDGWPRSVISKDPANEEALMEALRNGPYGRCVYHCDNDVVDHQIVTMEFVNGISASLTMHGHSEEECRTLRVDGTQATLFGKFGLNQSFLEVRDHRRSEIERIDFPSQVEAQGHGGGDFGVVRSFVRNMRGETEDLVLARDSIESHLMAFAAEESRLKGTMVDMAKFREIVEGSTS